MQSRARPHVRDVFLRRDGSIDFRMLRLASYGVVIAVPTALGAQSAFPSS
jgi:hypothetical protein